MPYNKSFAWSVRESIAFGFYRTDLAPWSLRLYKNLQAILSQTPSLSVYKSLYLILQRIYNLMSRE